jgi:hypothetical protein
MKLSASDIAYVCHEANRALQILTGDPAPSPEWAQAPLWQTESAQQGVLFAWDGATPEELHESWMESKRRDGWIYGPVKSVIALTHPCMVRYEELPPEQRLKDKLFSAIVEALTEEMSDSSV